MVVLSKVIKSIIKYCHLNRRTCLLSWLYTYCFSHFTCSCTILWTISWDCKPVTMHFLQYHRFCSYSILWETWRETCHIIFFVVAWKYRLPGKNGKTRDEKNDWRDGLQNAIHTLLVSPIFFSHSRQFDDKCLAGFMRWCRKKEEDKITKHYFQDFPNHSIEFYELITHRTWTNTIIFFSAISYHPEHCGLFSVQYFIYCYCSKKFFFVFSLWWTDNYLIFSLTIIIISSLFHQTGNNNLPLSKSNPLYYKITKLFSWKLLLKYFSLSTKNFFIPDYKISILY